MGLVSIGLGLHAGPVLGGWPFGAVRSSNPSDAVGESAAVIGRILLSSGPGTSKVFSAGGGATISWSNESTTTWANAGTTVRVGIQGVTAGLENGTWSLYGENVGGDGLVSNSLITETNMSTGSVTLAHGDLVAVVLELTTRAGTDSIRPLRQGDSAFPYGTVDTGAGPAKVTTGPLAVVLKADDGTLATFGDQFVPFVNTEFSLNSGSVPDEYAFIFQLPFSATTNQLTAWLGETDAAETAELLLYADPLGTPTVVRTVTIDPDYVAASASSTSYLTVPISEYALAANTPYAVSYRPTSTAPRNLRRRTFGSSTWKSLSWLGANHWGGSRSDQSGAFAQSDTVFSLLGCVLNKIQDDGPTNAEIAEAVWTYGNRELT